jgi:hypothetical protein
MNTRTALSAVFRDLTTSTRMNAMLVHVVATLDESKNQSSIVIGCPGVPEGTPQKIKYAIDELTDLIEIDDPVPKSITITINTLEDPAYPTLGKCISPLKWHDGLCLPAAVAILKCMGLLPPSCFRSTCMIGSFSGETCEIGYVRGALSIAEEVARQRSAGFKINLLVPEYNAYEVRVFCDDAIEMESLDKIYDDVWEGERYRDEESHFGYPEIPNFFEKNSETDVILPSKGQRILEIAATGNHGLLLVRNEGCDREKMADFVQRLHLILPPIGNEECIEIAKIASLYYPSCDDNPVLHDPLKVQTPIETYSRLHDPDGPNFPLYHHGLYRLPPFECFKENDFEVVERVMNERKAPIHAGNNELYPASLLFVGEIDASMIENRTEPLGKWTKIAQNLDLHVPLSPCISSDDDWDDIEETRKRVTVANQILLDVFGKKRWGTETVVDYSRISQNALSAFDGLSRPFDPKLDWRIYRIAMSIGALEGSDFIKRKHFEEAMTYRILPL